MHPFLLTCELCPPLRKRWAVCLQHTVGNPDHKGGTPLCLQHYDQADHSGGFVFWATQGARQVLEPVVYVPPPAPPGKKKASEQGPF